MRRDSAHAAQVADAQGGSWATGYSAVTALGSTIKTKFNDVVTGMGGAAGV
ncbi:hypothetical protein [Brevundimonas sp.]|uniref:hypothetical protein n=1 Tax=Brevundimonas sp. TaxID=1871086 RepID=UPI003F72EB0D